MNPDKNSKIENLDWESKTNIYPDGNPKFMNPNGNPKFINPDGNPKFMNLKWNPK